MCGMSCVVPPIEVAPASCLASKRLSHFNRKTGTKMQRSSITRTRNGIAGRSKDCWSWVTKNTTSKGIQTMATRVTDKMVMRQDTTTWFRYLTFRWHRYIPNSQLRMATQYAKSDNNGSFIHLRRFLIKKISARLDQSWRYSQFGIRKHGSNGTSTTATIHMP